MLARLLLVIGLLAGLVGLGVLLYTIFSESIDVSDMVDGGSRNGLPLVALGTVTLALGCVVAAVGGTMSKSVRRPRRNTYGLLEDDWY